jgi:preprotein translocase subunit SecD
MEKSIRTRAIFIALVIVACVIGIIGLPKNFEVLKENVRNRIRLGLDLRGGTHLVLQVHVEDAVNVTSDQAMERVRDELRAKNIPYVDVQKTDSTHVVVRGIPQAKAGDVRTLVSDQFSDWDVVAGPVDSASQTQTFIVAMKTTAAALTRNQALDQARETINNRINQLGVTEPVIADYGKPGDYELVVELPGVDDPARVKDIIQSTALLELKIVQDGPYPTKEASLGAHGGVLPPDSQLLQALKNPSGSGDPPWYIVNRVAAITGRDLTGATSGQDENSRPAVNFTLNRDGAARFGRVTGQNVGKLLAIVLDNRVVDAAEIHSQINDRGIIQGTFTPQQVADLSLVLRSGALPASITYLQEETVGPSLGADSIRHGVIASIVGLLAVMGFMLIYYRGGGINANVALILNLLLLIAALGYFGATLTLPGIAGVILTVGMGVDSNVLIFERIREELRSGKTVPAAVQGGFQHAFKTIIDTHVTTVASALILFTFGTGPIRGFAVTLTIGLLANLFTSVFVSRVIFDWILSRRMRDEPLSI